MRASCVTLLLVSLWLLNPVTTRSQWIQTGGPYGGIVNAVASDGTNLYAGMGSAGTGVASGVLRSTDIGSGWTQSGLDNLDVLSLVTKGQYVFAGTRFDGIFRSANNGVSWILVDSAFANVGITSLFVNGTELFAGTFSGAVRSNDNGVSWTGLGMGGRTVYCFAATGTGLFAGTNVGVYRSTDNGSNWTLVNSGTGNTTIFGVAAVDTIVFAGTASNGIYRSTNNGTNWFAVNTGLTNMKIRSLIGDGTRVFAGTEGGGVFVTTDLGASWNAVNAGMTHTFVHAFAISGTDLFAGTAGNGVFLSTNSGTSWAGINTGMANTNIRCFAVGANGPGSTNVFAGGYYCGVFRSSNNGASWSAMNDGLTIPIVDALAFHDPYVFAGTRGSGIFRSSNNGASWTPVNSGVQDDLIKALVVSGDNIFAGTAESGVYLSTNNGSNWTAVNSGLSAQSLVVSGVTLLAGSYNGEVFYSSNNGTSWTNVNISTTSDVSALAIVGSTFFAGTQGAGVFRSTDNGTTWAQTSLGGIIMYLTVSGTNVIAATYSNGVLVSADYGTSWNQVGLSNKNLYSVFVSDTSLFAGTSDNGVWRRLSFDITEPQAGDLWVAGETETIKWWGPFNSVDILYSVDYENGVGTFDTIVAGYPADSQFDWDIPEETLSKKCAVRVVGASNSSFTTTSEPFRIKGYILTRDSADQYEPFRFQQDRWNFGNSTANMWPASWYNQFNYNGTDPFIGLPYGWHMPFLAPFSSANSSDFPDWPLFVNTFGTNQCYWSTSLGIYYTYALYRWRAMKSSWGGSCFGFAISSLLAFDDSSGFRARYPGVPPYTDLFTVSLDNSIRKVVNELMIHQFGLTHHEYTNNALDNTPTQTVFELQQILLSENPNPGRLTLRNNGPGGGGHAITPYKVRRDSVNNQIYSIQVYDNSYPNTDTARIIVNTAANNGNGSWIAPLWAGWGGNKWLFRGDAVSTYLSRPDLEPSARIHSGAAGVEMFPSIQADVLIRNVSGGVVGYADSTVVDSLQGAHPFVPETGSKTPPYFYTVPQGSYEITMDTFADSNSHLIIFTDSSVFSYERFDALATQRDRIGYDGGLSLKNPDPETKQMYVSTLIVEDTTAEKLYTVTGLATSQNDSMRFSRVNHDDLKMVNVGSQKSYDLYVDYLSSTAHPRFRAFGINLEAGSTHLVDPVWTDLQQPVPIYVDLGNNGTIDDTIFVNNTVSVDDPGELFIPKEYNLSQNYPNPFNPYTTIRYALPQPSSVRLTVYNILGQEVVRLVDEVQTEGFHATRWDALNAAGNRVGSGVYIYRIEARSVEGDISYVATRKLIVLK